MQTIYKYDVNAGSIIVPKGSIVLSAGQQGGAIKVWVQQPVPSEKQETETIDLFYVGTGGDHKFSGKEVFIGTVQDTSGYVWHVFARYLDRE